MKKFLGIASALVLAASTCGCSQKQDWAYIADKGDMVIGITLYEPMNYYDENNNLTGFDTEFAQRVCKELGVEATFQVIDWKQKETELKSKKIDCIWNGLTVTEERKENMAFSNPYVDNKQVLIVKKDNLDKITAEGGLDGIKVAAESGSAGETAITEDDVIPNPVFVGCDAQKDVLMEVKAGTVDGGVIDYVMAISTIKEGTDYSDLVIVENVELTPEQYAIGFRLEDQETLKKVNDTVDKLVQEGWLQDLAAKYELSEILAY